MNNIDPLGVFGGSGDFTRTGASAKSGSSDFDSVLRSLLTRTERTGKSGSFFSASSASSGASEKASGDSFSLLELMRDAVRFEGGRKEKDTKHYNLSALAKIKELLAAGIGLSGDQTAELNELLVKFGDFFESGESSETGEESGQAGETSEPALSNAVSLSAAENEGTVLFDENGGVSEESAEEILKGTVSGSEPGSVLTGGSGADVETAAANAEFIPETAAGVNLTPEEGAASSDVSLKNGSAAAVRTAATDSASLRAASDAVLSGRSAVSDGAAGDTSDGFAEILKTGGASAKKDGETAAQADVNADTSRDRSVKTDVLKNIKNIIAAETESSGKTAANGGTEKSSAASAAASESVKKDVRLPEGVEVKDASASSGEKISRTETAKAVVGAKNSDGAFLDVGKEKITDTITRADSSSQNADAGFDRLLKETSSISRESRHSSGSSYDLRNGAELARLVKTLESSALKGNSKLTVTLAPENLGRLEIRLAEQGGKITARFFTDNETSHKMMLHQSEAIRSQLADKGIIIDNMEFSFNDASSGQSRGDGKKSFKNGMKRNLREAEENAEIGKDIANSTTKGVYA